MLQALLATVPATVASLGAWLAARNNGPINRVEAMVEDILDWQIVHERKHRMEGTP